MGTFHKIDSRLSKLENLDAYSTSLIELFKENYLEDKLEIGQFTNDLNERGALYTIVDSEFEHVIVSLMLNESREYQFLIQMIYLDSPIEMKISLDYYLVQQLPKDMIDDMESKLSDLRWN